MLCIIYNIDLASVSFQFVWDDEGQGLKKTDSIITLTSFTNTSIRV